MIIDEKTKRYIKEVYYYGDDDNIDGSVIKDIIKLLSGKLSTEQLHQRIVKAKIRDEKEYGDDIYKKEN